MQGMVVGVVDAYSVLEGMMWYVERVMLLMKHPAMEAGEC